MYIYVCVCVCVCVGVCVCSFIGESVPSWSQGRELTRSAARSDGLALQLAGLQADFEVEVLWAEELETTMAQVIYM